MIRVVPSTVSTPWSSNWCTEFLIVEMISYLLTNSKKPVYSVYSPNCTKLMSIKGKLKYIIVLFPVFCTSCMITVYQKYGR